MDDIHLLWLRLMELKRGSQMYYCIIVASLVRPWPPQSWELCPSLTFQMVNSGLRIAWDAAQWRVPICQSWMGKPDNPRALEDRPISLLLTHTHAH